jgi:glycosyltransferase involved in cell wall biosynthesis
VDCLYAGNSATGTPASEWTRLYEANGIEIRTIARSEEMVEPSYLARARDIERTLAADPPDVVIAQDLAAPASTALRTRQLGLGFDRTLFVVYCHGGRRWITDTARKVHVLPGAHAVTLLEQACVELADVVVSPSSYLVDWMRGERWRLPERSFVIPYLSRSTATGERPAAGRTNGDRVERIAFFGRLEERKGLRPFAEGLNALAPDLLRDVELEFVGAATPAWPRERIESLLSEETRRTLRRISFETSLDQPEALSRLSRPGTLAVMPSLGETFSNAVYECLERGIPFLASDAGAPPELVAAPDRSRVLFEPTAEGIASALRRALSDRGALRPAGLAFDPSDAYDEWSRVVQLQPEPRHRDPGHARVAVVTRGECTRVDPSCEWVVLLDDGDALDDDCVETLLRAQAASGADVVTCGVRLPAGERLFLGDPGGLGALANHYGTIGLIRRSLLDDKADREGSWQLFARLSLAGARVVSVPRALATSTTAPADVERDPAAALEVVRHFESHVPHALASVARLAAGLAASPTPRARRRAFLRRLLRR